MKPSKRDKFISDAYDDWAYTECMNYIYTHLNKDPIEACDEFRHLMDKGAMDAKTNYAKLIFASAYEAATQVLDDLIMTNVENITGGKII